VNTHLQDGIVQQRWLVKGGADIVFPTEPLLKPAQELPGDR
jgi:hypothetical protein